MLGMGGETAPLHVFDGMNGRSLECWGWTGGLRSYGVINAFSTWKGCGGVADPASRLKGYRRYIPGFC